MRRNVSVLLIAQAVTWPISIVLLVALPRYLGAEVIGQLQFVTSVWLIAGSFVGLGAQTLIALEIARHQQQGTSIVGDAMVAKSLAFILFSGIVAIVVAVADYGSTVATLFVIVGVGTLVSNIGSVAVAALVGFENFTLPSIASVIEKFLSTVIIVAALVLGANVQTIAAVTVGASVIHAAIAFRYLRRYAPHWQRPNVRRAWSVARRGAPYLFGGMAIVAYHEVDIVMMSILLDKTQIGWYAAADRLTASMLFIPTIVMSALFPTFARMNHEDSAAVRDMVARIFRTLILLAVPIGFGLATLSGPLTLLLFGDEFRNSGPVLAVLSIVLMAMFLTILLGYYAVASGHEKYYFTLIFAGTAAVVPLVIVLAPWADRTFGNGAIGGALVYVVTESVILGLAIRRFAPQIVCRETLVRMTKCVLGGTVMVAAVWPVRWIFPVVPIAVGAAIYLAVVIGLSTLTEEERRGVATLFARLRSSRPRRTPDSR